MQLITSDDKTVCRALTLISK